MKSKLIIKQKHLTIPFDKKGVLVCKCEPGTDKIILVVLVTENNGNLFSGIIVFTNLNSTDLYKSMSFKKEDFQLFEYEITITNDFKLV